MRPQPELDAAIDLLAQVPAGRLPAREEGFWHLLHLDFVRPRFPVSSGAHKGHVSGNVVSAKYWRRAMAACSGCSLGSARTARRTFRTTSSVAIRCGTRT